MFIIIILITAITFRGGGDLLTFEGQYCRLRSSSLAWGKLNWKESFIILNKLHNFTLFLMHTC